MNSYQISGLPSPYYEVQRGGLVIGLEDGVVPTGSKGVGQWELVRRCLHVFIVWLIQYDYSLCLVLLPFLVDNHSETMLVTSSLDSIINQ